MAKKSYDWVAIKIQFVNSSLTVQEFADKYSIPYGTLKKQATQGKWLDERSAIGAETVRKSNEISTDVRAAKLAQFDADCIALADDFRKKAKEFLHQIDSPMALKSLTGAMKETQAIARLALGASTENQATKTVQDFSDWVKELENGRAGSR